MPCSHWVWPAVFPSLSTSSSPFLFHHHTIIFGILSLGFLFLGFLLSVSSLEWKLLESWDLPFHAHCYLGGSGIAPATQQLLHKLFLECDWMILDCWDHTMSGLCRGRRYNGFCAGWTWRAVPLELSSSLCQNCPAGLSSRLLNSVQNCHLENLPLPWPPSTSCSSSLLSYHLFPIFNYSPSHSIVSMFVYLSFFPVRLWAFCQQGLSLDPGCLTQTYHWIP